MIRFFKGLWSGFWGKVLLIGAGVAAGAALILFLLLLWALDGKSDAEAREQTALDQVAKAEEENRRLGLSLEAAENTSERRADQREGQLQDEEAIRDEPVTYECAASPAVRSALGILRDRRAGDTPATDRPE